MHETLRNLCDTIRSVTTNSGHSANWIRTHEQARCALGAVTQTGMQIKTRPWFGFEHGYRYFGRYAAVLLMKGHGSYADDRGSRFDVEPGDMTLLFPDIGHRYGPRPGNVTHEIYVVFEGPMFDAWYRDGVFGADYVRLRLGDPTEWAQRLMDIVIHEARTEADALVEVARTQSFLADALRSVTHEAVVSAGSRWMRRAMEEIDATIPGPADWGEIATRLDVSTVTLRRRFRDHLDSSPGAYRNRRIIGRACLLMQQTELRDQEIADKLGVCDPQYFSRLFKQVVGSSPREYRGSLP